MARKTGLGSQKRLTLGFKMSITSFITLCAKHASRVSTKLKPFKPKQLLSQISSKAKMVVHNTKKIKRTEGVESDGVEFGDGGVWQRSILMGDKCQPLDFSGVIYYDSTGKQLNEDPSTLRSPRART